MAPGLEGARGGTQLGEGRGHRQGGQGLEGKEASLWAMAGGSSQNRQK